MPKTPWYIKLKFSLNLEMLITRLYSRSANFKNLKSEKRSIKICSTLADTNKIIKSLSLNVSFNKV